jgi:hypothetical protein
LPSLLSLLRFIFYILIIVLFRREHPYAC